MEYDGREMVCQHCGGDFLAESKSPVDEGSNDLLDRVDALLDSSPPRQPR